MLTVISNPRMMAFGGIQAAVGNAGGQKLAISNANDLAKANSISVEIRLEPGLIASVTNQASQVAVVRVTNDLHQDSPMSRSVKRLVS
jgi:hypothetical protein